MSLCESHLMSYQNPVQLLRLCQANCHECKNIHDQLKSHMENLGYQLSNIRLHLQIEFIYHQWNISSPYQYHKKIVLHTWPRIEYNISDHLSSSTIFPSLQCKLLALF